MHVKSSHFSFRVFLLFLQAAVISLTLSCSSDSSTNYQSWVVMFYADADNDLESYILSDINEIESVNYDRNRIKVIALIDRISGYANSDGDWTDTRAYEIGYDPAGFNNTLSSNSQRIAIPSLGITETGATECDMGSGDTIQKFVEFCRSNYSADRYMLIISDHGGGWRSTSGHSNSSKSLLQSSVGGAVSKDVCWDETNLNDYITMKELRTSLTGALNGSKLDILAFDACLMGMAEVCYELKDNADIIVASAHSVPMYGFPYTGIFTSINKTAASPAETAGIIVNGYADAYSNGLCVEAPYYTSEGYTISAVKTSGLSELVSQVNLLASEVTADPDCAARIATTHYTYRENIELWDFCNRTLSRYTHSSSVIQTIENSVLFHREGTDFPKHRGLAIYFPDAPLMYDGAPPSDYTSSNILFASDAPAWASLVASGIYGPDTDYEGGSGYGNNTQSASYYNINANLANAVSVSNTYIYYNGDTDWWCIDLAYQQGYPSTVQPASSLNIVIVSPSGVPLNFTVFGKNTSGETTETGTYADSAAISNTSQYDWGFYIRVQSADGTSFSNTYPYTITTSWTY